MFDAERCLNFHRYSYSLLVPSLIVAYLVWAKYRSGDDDK